jgi:hypothetical protein
VRRLYDVEYEEKSLGGSFLVVTCMYLSFRSPIRYCIELPMFDFILSNGCMATQLRIEGINNRRICWVQN